MKIFLIIIALILFTNCYSQTKEIRDAKEETAEYKRFYEKTKNILTLTKDEKKVDLKTQKELASYNFLAKSKNPREYYKLQSDDKSTNFHLSDYYITNKYHTSESEYILFDIYYGTHVLYGTITDVQVFHEKYPIPGEDEKWIVYKYKMETKEELNPYLSSYKKKTVEFLYSTSHRILQGMAMSDKSSLVEGKNYVVFINPMKNIYQMGELKSDLPILHLLRKKYEGFEVVENQILYPNHYFSSSDVISLKDVKKTVQENISKLVKWEEN